MLFPKPNTQYPILSIIIKEPDSAKSLTEYCPIMNEMWGALETGQSWAVFSLAERSSVPLFVISFLIGRIIGGWAVSHTKYSEKKNELDFHAFRNICALLSVINIWKIYVNVYTYIALSKHLIHNVYVYMLQPSVGLRLTSLFFG